MGTAGNELASRITWLLFLMSFFRLIAWEAKFRPGIWASKSLSTVCTD